ncbi:MAG: monovalent cation/H(+) antiporter subunit G [Spirochaetota bacterium]
MTWVALVFLVLGAVFALMGNLGVLIFPDVYTRLQASSTCSTTSVFSVFVACMIASGFSPLTGKIVVITLFFFLTNPISSHIIARFAWESEIVPWRRSYEERRTLEGGPDG